MAADKKKNLLIIDEDMQNRKELCALLSDEYNIIELENSSEGKPFFEKYETKVSAVILNVHNSQTEADSLLEFLQDSVELSVIPVLLLTDGNVSAEIVGKFGNGVTDCIEKPYNRNIILNRISNAIVLKDSMTLYGIEKMLKELPSNIYLKDKDGRYVFATHYWHHLEHDDDPDWTIRGKTDPEIRKDKENAIEAMKKDMEIIATGKGTSYTIEINADGIQEFFDVIKQPLFDDSGNVNGIIGLINNVTEHELLKRKLEVKARTDELTGLYNRTYFDEYMRNLQKKECYPISIISADCDKLKKINDTYGHSVGDDYIRMTTLLFKMVLPERSTAFRVGGDEFIIVLPSTSEKTAADYVAQMKSKEKLFQIKEQQLSVSFGIACMNDTEDSLMDCLAASDKNMYFEKRKGQ